MEERERCLEAAERELSAAVIAREKGNEGRVRVCARRAAGSAISWFLTIHPHTASGSDTMSMIAILRDAEDIPPIVRDAASRLSARVTGDFRYPPASDPIIDAKNIIAFVAGLPDAAHQ